MYKAHLVTITDISSVPEGLRGFVSFQAAYEGHQVHEQERIALLVVEGTASYIVIFIEKVKGIEEIEARLMKQHTEMTQDTRAAIENALNS